MLKANASRGLEFFFVVVVGGFSSTKKRFSRLLENNFHVDHQRASEIFSREERKKKKNLRARVERAKIQSKINANKS